MNSFLIVRIDCVLYPLAFVPGGCDRCFLVPRTDLVSSSRTQTRFLLHHLLYTLELAGLLLGGSFGRMIGRVFSLPGSVGRHAMWESCNQELSSFSRPWWDCLKLLFKFFFATFFCIIAVDWIARPNQRFITSNYQLSGFQSKNRTGLWLVTGPIETFPH
jgi:hypothetical protein